MISKTPRHLPSQSSAALLKSLNLRRLQAAFSHLSDTLYALSLVPASNNKNKTGVLTLLKLQLTPTPVLAECGQVRMSTQGVTQVAAGGTVVAAANSAGEVIMYSVASREVYQKVTQIALLSEA